MSLATVTLEQLQAYAAPRKQVVSRKFVEVASALALLRYGPRLSRSFSRNALRVVTRSGRFGSRYVSPQENAANMAAHLRSRLRHPRHRPGTLSDRVADENWRMEAPLQAGRVRMPWDRIPHDTNFVPGYFRGRGMKRTWVRGYYQP